MKFNITILLSALIMFFYNCKRNEKLKNSNISIKGNWYSFNMNSNLSGINEINNFLYKEFLYTDSNLFSYSDISGFNSPMKYEIIGDSLFWFFDLESRKLKKNTNEFIGLIEVINDSLFIIKGESDSLMFYKIKNKQLTKTLNQTIIENDSLYLKTQNEQKYMDDFRKRMQNCFDENK